MVNFLGGQFVPAHAIGKMPSRSLGGALIKVALAQHGQQFLNLCIFAERFDRADFVGNVRRRIFFAMLQADNRHFELADGFGCHVKSTAAAASTADPATAAAEPTAAATDVLILVVIAVVGRAVSISPNRRRRLRQSGAPTNASGNTTLSGCLVLF